MVGILLFSIQIGIFEIYIGTNFKNLFSVLTYKLYYAIFLGGN